MAKTFKFGENGKWATKTGLSLAYNDQNDNFKPMPFSVTRDSIATRVNKEGLIEVVGKDKLRIDYTDSTKGVALLEPARTNSLLQSNQFDTTWSNTRSSEQQGYTSPEGIDNAWAFIDTTDNSTHLMVQSLSIGAGTFTFSIFAKKGSKDFLAVRFEGGTGVDYAYFNLNTGLLGDIDSDYTSASMQDYGNGWYRCILTRTTAASGNQVVLYSAKDNGDITYAGDADNAIYIYGGQVENGAYPTSYIPTSGAAVPRVADVANGAGNSKVFNDSEGVLFANIAALANDGTNRQLSVSDGGSTQRVYFGFRANSNEVILSSRDSSYLIATISDTTNFNKYAFQYKSGSFKSFINGFDYDLTLDGGLLPTGLNTLSFDNGGDVQNLYGKTKEIGVYDTALTDAELEALTSYTSFTNMANELNLTIK